MARAARVVLVVTALLAGPHVARGDILPEPPPGADVRVSVDLGPYAASGNVRHLVRRGETLSGIAQARLGSAQRWKEIAALNPGLDPERLQPETSIVLPPPRPPADDAVPARWDFLAWIGSTELRPLVPAEPGGRAEQVRVVAVRHAERAEFDRARARQPEVHAVVSGLLGKPWIAVSGMIGGRTVGEPPAGTHEIRETWRVTGIEDGRVLLERTAQVPVDVRGVPVEGGPPGPLGGGRLVLLLLAAVAAVLLVLRGSTRAHEAAGGLGAPAPGRS